ncbi:SOS response-associated peptidase [Diaphorobacter sp. HDW4A]|uniref:SOS response-associated peptidase n=1 Tax=Diaphorobacter sp. HDW4A TaxID=2714924 RepID=UPI00140B06C8|nr:SOS response-associated peptidase family protein [Diaphorobacter sp. HDW4A]QIL82388.1 SOS response-associated peptidase [Diaphorobacter sp. HDW4A]
MSTQYEALKAAELFSTAFRVEAPSELSERQITPRQPAFFITRTLTPATDAERAAAPAPAPSGDEEKAPSPRLLVPGQFGLVPHWVKSASDARLRAPKLATVKSDLASTGTAFRDAWLNNQRCIIPMMAFITNDHRNGKPIPTRIARVDGLPMGVAGIWARWRDPETATELLSFAIVTVNANAHALMNRYQPPGAEKNMPAILNEGAYDAWLNARASQAKEFLRAYPAQKLLANPVEKKGRKPKPESWM